MAVGPNRQFELKGVDAGNPEPSSGSMIAAGFARATMVAVLDEQDGARTVESFTDPIDVMLPKDREVVWVTARAHYRTPEVTEFMRSSCAVL